MKASHECNFCSSLTDLGSKRIVPSMSGTSYETFFFFFQGNDEIIIQCSSTLNPAINNGSTDVLSAQHVNSEHASVHPAARISLPLASLLMDPLRLLLLFVFMGCDHVTAWLILMNAHIFPASCLHFRTSLRSITANRWVTLTVRYIDSLGFFFNFSWFYTIVVFSV